jgi:hypothetical protein
LASPAAAQLYRERTFWHRSWRMVILRAMSDVTRSLL